MIGGARSLNHGGGLGFGDDVLLLLIVFARLGYGGGGLWYLKISTRASSRHITLAVAHPGRGTGATIPPRTRRGHDLVARA